MEDKANTTDAPSSDAVTLPCWYDSVRIALLMTVSSVVLLCSVASVRQFSEDDRLNLLGQRGERREVVFRLGVGGKAGGGLLGCSPRGADEASGRRAGED